MDNKVQSIITDGTINSNQSINDEQKFTIYFDGRMYGF